MKSPLLHRSNMRHRMSNRKLLFPADFQLPPRLPSASHTSLKEPRSVYDAWLASRELAAQPGHYLVPGAPRPLTVENARLALFISQTCTFDFVSHVILCQPFPVRLWLYIQFRVLFDLNPFRTTLMMTLNVVRSIFPAFRGYSQVCLISGFVLTLCLHSLPGSDS